MSNQCKLSVCKRLLDLHARRQPVIELTVFKVFNCLHEPLIFLQTDSPCFHR